MEPGKYEDEKIGLSTSIKEKTIDSTKQIKNNNIAKETDKNQLWSYTNLFINLFVRLLYLAIGLHIRVVLYGTFEQDGTLTLTLPYILIASIETIYAIRKKLDNPKWTYKYFSPPALITIFYIFIGVVSNKFLGLGGDKNYLLDSDDEILNKVTLIVVGGLIIGKYLLPKNKRQSSRDASMIYIVYVGMALDNWEFATSDIVTSTETEYLEANQWLFLIWSFSLFPFGMNPFMRQSGSSKKKNTVRSRFKTCLQDDLSIFLMVFFQEIPYLIFRLKYLKIYEVDEMYNYSFNWGAATMVMKNTGIIFFFINRLVVYIFDENDDGKITLTDLIEMWKKTTNRLKPVIIFVFGSIGAILIMIGLVIREKFLTEGKPPIYTKLIFDDGHTHVMHTWHKWKNQKYKTSYPLFMVQSRRDPSNPGKRKSFSRFEAQQNCISYHGTLAAITNQSQQSLVYDLLKQQIVKDFKEYPEEFSSNSNFKLRESREMAWIGGLRDGKNGNRWMWETKNLAIDESDSYNNWYNDEQPNDQIDGDCMLMNFARRYETSVPGNFGKWDNEKCETKLKYFVCQMEDTN